MTAPYTPQSHPLAGLTPDRSTITKMIEQAQLIAVAISRKDRK